MDDIGMPPTRIPEGLSGQQLHAWLEGLMHFPDNGPFAQSWFVRRALMANGPLSWRSRKPIPVEERDLRALLDGPSGDELESLSAAREKDGETVGILLGLIYGMSRSGVQSPSLGKAASIIEKTSTIKTHNYRHVSRSRCMTAWKLMQPVAHLWAGVVFAPAKWKKGGTEVILSIASTFREFGCTFVSERKRGRPLLDCESTLDTGRIPADLGTIKLPADVEAILSKYSVLGGTD